MLLFKNSIKILNLNQLFIENIKTIIRYCMFNELLTGKIYNFDI